MSVASFSAHRLDKLLAEIAAQPTIGFDLLREIATQLRGAAGAMDDAPKKVVTWVLTKTMDAICDQYDGEPMTVDQSVGLQRFVQGPVQDGLRFLLENGRGSNDKAVELAVQLIGKYVS